MPWKETRVMDARLELVELINDGESISEACRQFGVSRKTAYKWLARYEEQGVEGLRDQSRRPLSSPSALDTAVTERILLLRAERPTWGPRKLKAWLERHEPDVAWPAHSTIGALLRRNGLTRKRRKTRPLHPRSEPLAHCTSPNRVWCADFKGWFRTGDGQRCDPLTITDGFSRYLLCLQALAHPTLKAVLPYFAAAFREFGLPQAIRTDNGVPFAATSGLGLSQLSVWWIDLGITPERIDSGKPQQNGRHERMHRTLKEETLRPPAENLRNQQCRFVQFREGYNHQRPHESLNQQPPTDFYTPSPRSYPVRIGPPEYESSAVVCRVYDKGSFRYGGKLYFLSDVLGGRRVALMPTDDDAQLRIFYRHVPIALLNLRDKQIEPIKKKKKRGRKKASKSDSTHQP